MTRAERKQFFAASGLKRKDNRRLIRAVLLHEGETEASIARKLGLTSQAVCRVLAGLAHTPLILQALRDAGVPEKYIFDPRLELDNAE